ncbi:hypothetical protein [Aurantiacibacter aquimixticola]|uniref:Uncharacterized protein n=1 Tax=Aurantiacibacter aquimixticola TaxID=1958945 RepID=A0A419RUD7_9SPHN|nr:hypothetical protein [Aurantiacibacter aquimixticola]RJY09396.1 hypothetical protein D6201_08540 [Aurantiacibacter aquimixticola]
MALATCAPAAQAQTATASETSIGDILPMVLDDQIMPALIILEQIIAEDERASRIGAQYWSLSGDLGTADELWVRTVDPPSGALPDLSQAQPMPAIEEIVRQSAGKRVVIINEAHHSPRHRAFTHHLMLALREEGFTHFAAEAFCSGAHCGSLLMNGAPMGGGDTGFYVIEPVFGDLARQAGATGYSLVGYEMTPEQKANAGANPDIDSMNFRELAQAENLKAALDADPDMRVLIHVGFGHVEESLPERPLHLFAGRLKELTGEDPLTIDQTLGTPQPGNHDNLLYQAFMEEFGAPSSSMAIAYGQDRPSGIYRTDLSVFHPESQMVNGRPDWLSMTGYRRSHTIALEPLSQRSLVRAFLVGEPAGAVAMDQMLTNPNADAVTLMLPRGEYRLMRQNEAGDNIPLGSVSID